VQGTTDHQATTAAWQRLPELDGIRGLAITLVLIWHYGCLYLPRSNQGPLLTELFKLLSLTWSGVDLFFVLSGFLIGNILIRQRRATNYFTVFYTRRLLRIMPVYLVWLALFILADKLIVTPDQPLRELFEPVIPLWTYPLFVQNWAMAITSSFGAQWLGITWSLAVEEQFYLLLPLIVYLVPLRKLPIVLIGMIIVAPVLRITLHVASLTPNPGLTAYLLMPCRMDALMAGALCAYLLQHQHARAYLATHRPHLYGLFVLALGGVVTIALNGWAIGSFEIAFGYSLIAGLYTSLLLIVLTEQRGPISALVRNPLLRRLGVVAYGVYLFHQGVNGLLHALILEQSPRFNTIADAAVTSLALLVTLGLAGLSWALLERPLINAGRKLDYQHHGP
jgi:peptidoglycan/LPS O-acetylase OafA/YrhL